MNAVYLNDGRFGAAYLIRKHLSLCQTLATDVCRYDWLFVVIRTHHT